MKSRFPLVTLKQALKLKGLGFNWEVLAFYRTTDKWKNDYDLAWGHENHNRNEHTISLPTVSHSLRWLREEKDMFVKVFPMGKGTWMFNVTFLAKWKGSTSDMLHDDKVKPFKTYDKSESAGLDLALDYLLKNKKL